MKKNLSVCSILMFLLIAVSASADTMTYQITIPNTELQPYTPPYAEVLVDRTDSTHATITMTALSQYAIGDGKSFDLNTNGAVSVSNLTSGFSVATPNNNVSDFGIFNLIINDGNGFSNPYFNVSVTLTLSSGTWANASEVLTGNNEGYIIAGHFGVPGATGGYPVTGFAGNGPPIPEPATMLLLGSGLLGLAGFARRRFKK